LPIDCGDTELSRHSGMAWDYGSTMAKLGNGHC
jgi:hypothetical protein